MKKIFAMFLFGFVILLLVLSVKNHLSKPLVVSPTPQLTEVVISITPSLTPVETVPPDMQQEVNKIITAYYFAIERQDYLTAYTYLDPQAVDDQGHIITESSFVHLAQSMDSQEGIVNSFDIGIFPPSTEVVMTMSRKKLDSYHTHITVKQESSTWKITSIDRI